MKKFCLVAVMASLGVAVTADAKAQSRTNASSLPSALAGKTLGGRIQGMPGSAGAQGVTMQLGSDWRAMSVLTCTNKAIVSMQNRPQFIRSERKNDKDNMVWGAYESATILVYCIAQNNGVFVEVITASYNSGEAESLRNDIRNAVLNGPDPDPKVRYPDYNNFNSILGGKPRPYIFPALHWGTDTRPLGVEDCVSRAASAVKAKNLSPTQGNGYVFGTGPSITTLVTCTAVEGGVYVVVVAASPQSAMAERYRNDIREAVFTGSAPSRIININPGVLR